jgi:hypothetical protein
MFTLHHFTTCRSIKNSHTNEGIALVTHQDTMSKKSLKLTAEKFFQDFIEILEKYL